MAAWFRRRSESRDRSSPRPDRRPSVPTRSPLTKRDIRWSEKRVGSREAAFQFKQPALGLEPRSAAVTAQGAVARDDAVTGDDDGDRIARQRLADGPAGTRAARS